MDVNKAVLLSIRVVMRFIGAPVLASIGGAWAFGDDSARLSC